ncbi:hypothetical protein M9458_054429, partial [Cirrhinus mrigala]
KKAAPFNRPVELTDCHESGPERKSARHQRSPCHFTLHRLLHHIPDYISHHSLH